MGLSFCKRSTTSKVCLSKGIICVMINILISKHQALFGWFLKHVLVPTILRLKNHKRL